MPGANASKRKTLPWYKLTLKTHKDRNEVRLKWNKENIAFYPRTTPNALKPLNLPKLSVLSLSENDLKMTVQGLLRTFVFKQWILSLT